MMVDPGQTISMADVLRTFIRCEADKETSIPHQAEMRERAGDPDATFIEWVKGFASRYAPQNPVFTWTVGTKGNRHHEQVFHWEQRIVDVDQVYCYRINSAIEAALLSVGGNLKQFSELVVASPSTYPEFSLNRKPKPAKTWIIGVDHTRPDRIGTIELIDGAHRLIGMACHDVTQTPAFVAVVRS